jgi:hypothetical protein
MKSNFQVAGTQSLIRHVFTFHNTSGLAYENGRGGSETNHEHDVMSDSILQYAFMQSI